MVDFVESATQIAHNANKNSAHEGIARSVMLVRHGQTPYNAQFRLQGMIDIALDESGIDQVTRSGKALRVLFGASDLEDPKNPNSEEHVRITPEEADASFVAIASPLIRAQQTAHAFADKIELNVHVENGVRERFLESGKALIASKLTKNGLKILSHGLMAKVVNSTTVQKLSKKLASARRKLLRIGRAKLARIAIC